MTICQGCGGVLGRDCFHEQDCIEISRQQAQQNIMSDYQRQVISILSEIRDKFAMSALQGLIASNKYGLHGEVLSIEAYKIADAMLMARKVKI